MLNFVNAPPLSLYVHIPWCVRKCPYCDFNSHVAKDSLPQALYTEILIQELDNYLPLLDGRPLTSIFFGGGTPSLFSAQYIAEILNGIKERIPLNSNIEISLEANPGTVEQAQFRAFREAGINRLSLGIQSLQSEKLKTLGRIHGKEEALNALSLVREAGFDNFNIDLMFGLPNQSCQDALDDLTLALSFQPTHFSWYQLTIEPNTLFYQQRPILPSDDQTFVMQHAGQALLAEHQYLQYEVSAYAKKSYECQHNRNYWEFGDYLGIGAGAHSKITNIKEKKVLRFSQVKHPKDYLDKTKRQHPNTKTVSEDELIFEFMLNALRLTQGVPQSHFVKHTGLGIEKITKVSNEAKKRNLLLDHPDYIIPSQLGRNFLNDLISMFLPR